jgi:hypothetical protein
MKNFDLPCHKINHVIDLMYTNNVNCLTRALSDILLTYLLFQSNLSPRVYIC